MGAERSFSVSMTKFFVAQQRSIVREARSLGVIPVDANQVFRPREWDKRLKSEAGAAMAVAFVEGAKSQFSLTKMVVEAVKSGTTAQDVAARFDIDIPSSIMLEFPERMLQSMSNYLRESLSQPYWDGINSTTSDDLQKVINSGLRGGWSMARFARELSGNIKDYSKSRGLAVARTEAGAALNAGHQAAIRELSKEDTSTQFGKEWVSVLGTTTRATHAAMDGKIVKDDGLFLLAGIRIPFPAHHKLPPRERVNCFPGDVQVSGAITKAMRVWYEGTVTEVISRSGRRITLTPNHGVMTSCGMVPAGQLKPGDNLVSHCGQIDGSFGGRSSGDDKQNEPVLSKDLFQALSLGGGVVPGTVEIRSCTPDDFDSDGVFCKGNVEIVSPDWELLEAIKSGRFEEEEDSRFFREYPQAFTKTGYSPSSLLVGAVGSSPDSIVRVFDDFSFVRLGGVGKSLALGVGVRSDFYSGAFESSQQERPAVTRFNADLLKRFSGEVFFDEIVEIEYRFFSGHVYDFETLDHLIVANGIVISNCQCTIVTSIITEGLDQISEDQAEAPADTPEESPAKPEVVEPPPFEIPDGLSIGEQILYLANNHPELKAVEERLSKVRARPEERKRSSRAQEFYDAMKSSKASIERKVARLARETNPEKKRRLQNEIVKKEGEYKRFKERYKKAKVKYPGALSDQERQDVMRAIKIANSERNTFRAQEVVPPIPEPESTGVFREDARARRNEAQEFLHRITSKRINAITTYRHNAMHRGSRAYARPDIGEIFMADDNGTSTYVHEIGHLIEGSIDGGTAMSAAFVKQRIKNAGTKDVKMNTLHPAFREDEVGNNDDFGKFFDKGDLADYYAGKVYKRSSGEIRFTETISMGLEAMYDDAKRFMRKDPEYAKFVLGYVGGIFSWDGRSKKIKVNR